MIRIFLVEDEFYALAALKQKIIDIGENYEVIGTAANGAEALEALKTSSPDILMTDIRMPDMDGITLIAKLREQKSEVLPVIISGYQEFDYAKQAVRLGVQDYLLKPVNPAELEDCLKRCVERLSERISKKNIFSFLIGDEAFRLEALADCASFTVVYLIFANALSNLENIVHPSVGFLPGSSVRECLEAVLTPCGQIFCYNGIFSNEKVIILENTPAGRHFEETELNRAAAALSGLSGNYVTIFFTANDGTGLSRDIQRARKGAVSSIMLGRTGVYSRIPIADIPAENLNDQVELFSLLLQQNQTALLSSNVRRLFRQWREHTLSTLQSDLVFILNSLKRKFASRKPFDFDSLFFVENLVSFSAGEDELADSFSQLLTEFFSFQLQTAELSAEKLVERIEEYFHENLAGNISLQDLADELNISKVYLCRIFKKYKNTTPIDYFTHMKADRAEELITQFPELSLREISEALGFNDVYYFSKVFKKIKGMPPSEVRKLPER